MRTINKNRKNSIDEKKNKRIKEEVEQISLQNIREQNWRIDEKCIIG